MFLRIKLFVKGTAVVENATYTNVPMVRINGREYQQSSLVFESNVELYTLDGTKTMYRVSSGDNDIYSIYQINS